MYQIHSDRGVTLSYERQGNGPPLVLVHGSFSDYQTNWELVLPFFTQKFTVYAFARRGRGETDDISERSVQDESLDVCELISTIGKPVFLLGHSYGAHVALGAAAIVPYRVRKLLLYEPPWPRIIGREIPKPLQEYSKAGNWDAFSFWFFRNILSVPQDELTAIRTTPLWEPIVTDAQASFGDLQALSKYRFDPEPFAKLKMPVLLQVGSESPRDLYVTDALAAVLSDVRIATLAGQAHEGMTTAPEEYARVVMPFLSSMS